MRNETESDAGDDVVGAKVHAAAITKFLWGVASTLAGAWVIASISFAWSVNSHCVEFREAITQIRSDDARLAADIARLHDLLDGFPPSAELVGLRADVSQLQYNSVTSIQALNDLTRQVRDLHPWPVPSRGQAPSAPNP